MTALRSSASRAQLASLRRARIWRERAEQLRQMAGAFEGDARQELEELAQHWDSYADWAIRNLPEELRREAS